MKAVTETHDGLIVNIDVSPNARRFEITGYNSWRERIEVRIKALAQKGKANKEIVNEFSALTNREVELISGLKSQQKTLKIYGMDQKDFLELISPFLH
jgi:uncharacterized protein